MCVAADDISDHVFQPGSGSEIRHVGQAHAYGARFGAEGCGRQVASRTIIRIVVAIFMESWLFGFNGYPMRGSWFWITLSEVMFVLAAQGMALFFYCVLPNLRLALSISALLGVLSFSLAAFSFPVESMYPAMGIFSWILPTGYNFLIYIDQALNGIDIYYSRIWFVAYIIFMLLPFTMMWRLKKAFLRPAYVK